MTKPAASPHRDLQLLGGPAGIPQLQAEGEGLSRLDPRGPLGGCQDLQGSKIHGREGQHGGHGVRGGFCGGQGGSWLKLLAAAGPQAAAPVPACCPAQGDREV